MNAIYQGQDTQLLDGCVSTASRILSELVRHLQSESTRETGHPDISPSAAAAEVVMEAGSGLPSTFSHAPSSTRNGQGTHEQKQELPLDSTTISSSQSISADRLFQKIIVECIALFLFDGKNDYFLLHLLTTAWALRRLAPFLLNSMISSPRSNHLKELSLCSICSLIRLDCSRTQSLGSHAP